MATVVSHEYSWLGYETATSNGATTTARTFNTHGDVLTERTGTLAPVVYTYDGLGRPVRVDNPDGTATEATYDQAGRMVGEAFIDSTGATVSTTAAAYDPEGNVLTATSPRGFDTTYAYNAMGDLTLVTQPVDGSVSITTSYTYDPAGNPTSFTDGDGHITRYAYNGWDLRTHTVEPSATTSPVEPEADRAFLTVYDAAGRPEGEVQPGGREVFREFNAMGLPEAEVWTDPGAVFQVGKEWGYDKTGRTTWALHPDQPLTFGYDDRGLMVATDGGAGTTRVMHDPAGREIARLDESGTQLTTYDPNGQVDAVTHAEPGAPSLYPGIKQITVDAAPAAGEPAYGLQVDGTASTEEHTVTGPAGVFSTGNFTVPDPVTVNDVTVTFGADIEHTGSIVQVVAVGQVGGENIELSIDGTVVDAWVLDADPTGFYTSSPEYRTYTYAHPSVITDEDVKIEFTNDTSTPVDRNVRVDAIVVDGTRYESEDPGVEATGVYQHGGNCQQGYWESEVLSCNGYLDYPVDQAGTSSGPAGPGSSTVEIIAVGRVGGEAIELRIDDVTVDSWVLDADTTGFYAADPDFATYTYTHTGPITDQDIKIAHTNGDSGGRDARVDAIVVDGTRYESEDPDVYSDGAVYVNGGDCQPGNWQSGIMHCNGWLQYPVDQPLPPGAPGPDALQVDHITVDGHSYPAADTAVTKLGVSAEGCGNEVNTTDDVLDCQAGWFDYAAVTDLHDPGAPPAGQVTVTYERDPDTGRATGIGYPDGGARAFAYDDAGRVVSDTLTDDTSTVTASFGYGWDCENNLVSKSIDLAGNTGSGDHTYTYDRAGRLTSWDHGGNPATTPACGEATPAGEAYTYDNRGNRLTAGADTFTYDNRNRLLSDPDGTYTWSDAGAMETFTPTSGPTVTYGRDAAHRLAEVDDGTVDLGYGYDSLDRVTDRTDSTGSDEFAYTGGQIDPTADGGDLYARTRSGNLLAVGDPTTGDWEFPLTDLHGDLLALIEPDGTVAGTTTYNPYGEVEDQTGNQTGLGYQSDWTDPDTDLVWMGARWYQPSSATFLTRDTYSGELSAPFTLNRYTYAVNNPVRYWDPDGHRISIGNETGIGIADPRPKPAAQKPKVSETDRRIATYLSNVNPVSLAESVSSNTGYEAPNNFWLPADDGGYTTPMFTGRSDGDVHADDNVLTWIGEDIQSRPAITGLEDAAAANIALANSGLDGYSPGPCSSQRVNSFTAMFGCFGAGIDFAGRLLIFDYKPCVGEQTSGGGCALELALLGIPADRILRVGGKIIIRASDEIAAFVFRHLDEAAGTVSDAAGIACRNLNSFSADTEVLFADGTTEPISQVQVGDQVLATNPETGETGPRPVEAVWPHQDRLLDLHTSAGPVTTTEDHHFWNATDGEWQESQDLDPGDQLHTPDGDTVLVEGLNWATTHTADAYDVTIADLHTYHVLTGDKPVLVHNTGGPPIPCGPGTWEIDLNEASMPDRAADYQQQITGGAPAGLVYLVDGVKFDGYTDGVLLDAKGPGYAGFVEDGQLKPWVQNWDPIKDAERQLSAANGTPIRWEIAEAEVATTVQQMFDDAGIAGIDVVHVPPT